MNQATITCPIFNVDTKVAACVELRNRVWSGKQVEVRKGCQACMKSSKCPIAREYGRGNNRNEQFDYLVSNQPKHVKLRKLVLDEIAPVVVQDSHLNALGVTAGERSLIMSANTRIIAQGASAPKAETPTRRSPKAAAPATDHAAATGDLAAAINKAA
jgi:hypothetical protein